MSQHGKLTRAGAFRRLEEVERRAELAGTGFEDDSPEKKAERIARALVDPLFFCQTYLPHWFRSEPAVFHGEWLQKLADYAVIGDNDLPRGVANICPRGFAKTTVANFGISAWFAVKNVLPFWCTCFDILSKGQEVVEAVADELRENRKIRGDFGDLFKDLDKTDGRWRLITTHGACFQALGMNASFRGLKYKQHRPHLVLIDDPETTIGVRNPKQRELVRNIVAGDLRLALEPGGTLWCNQNVIHPDCFNAHIAACVSRAADAEQLGVELADKAWTDWDVFEYPADRDGESMWPSRFTYAGLMAIRRAAPDTYDMEMRGLRIEGELKVFPRSVIHFYDEAELVQSPRALWHVVSLDPSKGKTDRSDYSALIVLGVDVPGGVVFVRKADLQRRNDLAMVADFCDAVIEYRAALGVIEDVAFQELLKNQIEAELARRGVSIPIVGFHSSTPKELRIESLAAPVRQGVILFQADQLLMLEQLEQFPNGAHDDGPDGLHMGWSETPVGRFAGQGWVDWSQVRIGRGGVQQRSSGGIWEDGEDRFTFSRSARRLGAGGMQGF